MGFRKVFYNYFFDDKYTLQHRLLNVLLLVGIVGGTVALSVSVSHHADSKSLLFTTLILALSVLALIITNCFDCSQITIIALSLILNNILMPALYVTSGGYESGMPLWITLGLVFTILLLNGKICWITFAINLLGVFAAVLYGPYIYARFFTGSPAVPAPDVQSIPFVIIDVLVAIIALVLTLGAIFKYQSYAYRRQQESLIDSIIEAQRANKAKSDFLSNMSHDIRTPMNAIIGYTEIMKKNLDDRKKLVDCIAKVTLSSNHLLRLINDVLDMTKIESGKFSFEAETFNLRTIINEIQDIVMQLLLEKNMHLHIDTSRLVDETVSCDRLRLNQVLINLVGNAIKYSNPGGNVWVSVIQLPDENENEIRVEIRVRDDGLGMSEEFVEKVFNPFERERNSTKSGIQGTGLGLSITKAIVEMMRGSISVTSELGKGSEFVVIVPLEVPTLLEISDDEGSAQENFDFSGRRILLVEDNAFNREIAVELLSDVGFEVEEADDGSVSLEMLARKPAGYYSAVIMDLQMPVMDGYEATRKIRGLQDIRIASIPIVAMTANAFSEDKKKALDCGMNAYLTKPINVKDLLGVMRLVLHDNEGKS
ncbi:MAG: response regulator [Treponema sp.]|nr:response regulator [Treponema sp.]